MPNVPEIQSDRRRTIRQILEPGPAGTQQSLLDTLTLQGFCRDAIERQPRPEGTGRNKTAQSYELPDVEHDDVEVAEVSGLFRQIETAGCHLLVMKTAISAAQRVALTLDRSGWSATSVAMTRCLWQPGMPQAKETFLQKLTAHPPASGPRGSCDQARRSRKCTARLPW